MSLCGIFFFFVSQSGRLRNHGLGLGFGFGFVTYLENGCFPPYGASNRQTEPKPEPMWERKLKSWFCKHRKASTVFGPK